MKISQISALAALIILPISGHAELINLDWSVADPEAAFAVPAVQPEFFLPVAPPPSVTGYWTSSAPAFFFNEIPTSAWADPLPSSKFYFQTTDGSHFTFLGLPKGAWDPFHIYDGQGHLIGTATPGFVLRVHHADRQL